MNDIIFLVADKLSDKYKINMFNVNIDFYKLKDELLLNNRVSYDKIVNIKYFDNFTNIYFPNEDIDNLVLPKNIKRLTFGPYFNQLIQNIPNSVTHLTFGICFNKPIENIPNSVTHLIFGCNFNQLIQNIPNLVTHLTFGHSFDQLIQNIPNSVTHLTFGFRFNQLIQNIPNSVTHLTFGYRFNQPIQNIPDSLTHLTFGDCFNQAIDCILYSIKYLTFGFHFNQHINFNMFQYLTYISFDKEYIRKRNIFLFGTKFCLGNSVKRDLHLPKSLKYFNCGDINMVAQYK